MSRRIDCRLTDAQWDELVTSVAYRSMHLEDQGDYERDEGRAVATRQRGVHDRMWSRVMGWTS